MTNSAHVEYFEKVVAFLDIPGFRQLILGSRDHASAVIKGLEAALAQSLENLALEGGPDWVSVKRSSDCSCLSDGYNRYQVLQTVQSWKRQVALRFVDPSLGW